MSVNSSSTDRPEKGRSNTDEQDPAPSSGGKRSPRITDLSWGRLVVDGQSDPFKDAKCYPGGARAWDWNETGTRHSPGIQPEDVTELLDHGAEVVVLSKGINERLQVCRETLNMLAENEIPVHVLQTEKAVEQYNRLCDKAPVGGLFHSTC